MGFPLARRLAVAAAALAFAGVLAHADPPKTDANGEVCEVPEGGLKPISLNEMRAAIGMDPVKDQSRVGDEPAKGPDDGFRGSGTAEVEVNRAAKGDFGDPPPDRVNTELRAFDAGRERGTGENVTVVEKTPASEIPLPTRNPRREAPDTGDAQAEAKSRTVVPALGRGQAVDPDKLPAGAQNQPVTTKPKTDPAADPNLNANKNPGGFNRADPNETPEQRKKREEERAKYYDKLSKDLMKSFGGGLDSGEKKDGEEPKPKNHKMGSLDSMAAAGGRFSGTGSAGPGAAPSGPRGGTPGSSGQAASLRRNIAMLSNIPGTRETLARSGVAIRDGRVLGSEEALMRAEQELNGLPLQAMMRHPGILTQVGAGDALKGREKYESVRSVVENGAGGPHTADLGSDHSSLVFTATRRRGLDSQFNPHHDAVSYHRGETVPGPTVSSIYDALFGSGDDENDPALARARAKLGRSSLGSEAGKGVWDRLKGAFSSVVSGDEASGDGRASPRMAAAVFPGGFSAAGSAGGRRAAPRQRLRFPPRDDGAASDGKADLVEYESRGLTSRDLMWGVSGGLGFGILLFWAFRGRKED